MKKLILLGLMIIAGLFGDLAACDLCGGFMGVQPQYGRNYLSLRMRYRYFHGNVPHFHTHADGSDHEHANQLTNEHYNTLELWGRFYPHPNIQILAWIPFKYNYSIEGGNPTAIWGLGDIQSLFRYKCFNLENSTRRRSQTLFAGLGLKIPTGSFKKPKQDGEIESHLQAGTGSFDFIASSGYYFRQGEWGFSIEALYKKNLANGLGYRWADQTNLSAWAFYWGSLPKLNLSPSVGLTFEYAGDDFISKERAVNTGGAILLAGTGFDLYFNKIILKANLQMPLVQALNGVQIKNKIRSSLELGFIF